MNMPPCACPGLFAPDYFRLNPLDSPEEYCSIGSLFGRRLSHKILEEIRIRGFASLSFSLRIRFGTSQAQNLTTARQSVRSRIRSAAIATTDFLVGKHSTQPPQVARQRIGERFQDGLRRPRNALSLRYHGPTQPPAIADHPRGAPRCH